MILILFSIVAALVGAVCWDLHEIGLAVWLFLAAAALGLPSLWFAVVDVARTIRRIDERRAAVDALEREQRPAA